MLSVSELNDEVFSNFNKDYFFDGLWKKSYGSLELIVTDKCDHSCTYCYYKRYGDKFFDSNSRNEETILKNLGLLINWLNKNEYIASDTSFLSGELLSTNIWYEVLDTIYNNYLRPSKPIMLPTNMSFIGDDIKTKKLLELKKKIEDKGSILAISASIDGKYMEENRPFISGRKRDDEYYNQLFSFCKQHRAGLHPMIYSHNIEKMKDNFLWFMENFNKYNLDMEQMYFLEVRNSEWSIEQTIEYSKFVEFVLDWVFIELCNKDKEKFVEWIFTNGFNFLRTPFISISRGLGCSIQQTFCVTLGDLTIPSCHRTAYRHLLGGRFVVENDEIVGMKADNFTAYINMKCVDTKTQPYCECCSIKTFCEKGCLGAQYEETGFLFLPIPSVCRLQTAKITTIIKYFKKIGVLDLISYKIPRVKFKQILKIVKENSL